MSTAGRACPASGPTSVGTGADAGAGTGPGPGPRSIPPVNLPIKRKYFFLYFIYFF